ncbi:MAG: nucleotide exchange factor GrpE [Bacteroidales bacterium]
MKKDNIQGQEDKEAQKDTEQPTGKDAESTNEEAGAMAEEQIKEEEGAAEDSGQDDESDKIAAYEKQLLDQKDKLADANEKFLRLFSEFDNYRKRVNKERIEFAKTAAEEIIAALLPILDDLERASQNAIEQAEKDAEQEGIVLIYNKFKTILRQKGVEEISASGADFDTDYHEAITHVPAENKKQKGKVVEEVQKGYLLNGKVIRHARVVVAN